VRIALPRLATLEVTVILPNGWAAAGADVRIHGLAETAAQSLADSRGRASFALDPDRLSTLSATLQPDPACPCFVSRPEFLRGRLHAGSRTEVVLLLEERRAATLEEIVVDATENQLVEIDGGERVEPHRGIVRRETRTGSHRIRLVNRHGDLISERYLWVPSDASILRVVLSP
jgi:hypothetical protein